LQARNRNDNFVNHTRQYLIGFHVPGMGRDRRGEWISRLQRLIGLRATLRTKEAKEY
jgi:hypothetical protein